MDESQGISRRRVMRVGAVIASSAAAVADVGDAAAADPRNSGRPTGGRAGRPRTGGAFAVSNGSRGAAGHTAIRPRRCRRGGAVHRVPEDVAPRVGDLVTVTDAWPGVVLAAIPVCHRVAGAPKALPGGGVQIGDTRVVASPLLKDVIGSRIRVCILGTELPTAQVLATRPT